MLHEKGTLAAQEGGKSFHPSSSQVRREMEIKEMRVCGGGAEEGKEGATRPELPPAPESWS